MGNGSSVMSSKPESVPSGTPMKMGGDWSDYGDGGDFGNGDSCGCDSCGGCGGCCFNPCGCCGWYGQVDYLLIRPTFSEQQAFLSRTMVTDPNTENTVTTDQVIHQDYGYNSSIRTYSGTDLAAVTKFASATGTSAPTRTYLAFRPLAASSLVRES